MFWIFFSIIHIIATLLLSTQLYYMGRWKLGEAPPRDRDGGQSQTPNGHRRQASPARGSLSLRRGLSGPMALERLHQVTAQPSSLLSIPHGQASLRTGRASQAPSHLGRCQSCRLNSHRRRLHLLGGLWGPAWPGLL